MTHGPEAIPRMMFVNIYARIRPSLWSTSGAAVAPTLEICLFSLRGLVNVNPGFIKPQTVV